MPYNPGVRDNSGANIAQGINQGKSALMQMIGWVMDQSSQNKQLEKTLSTAFPEQKDEIKGMSLDQKKGFMAGQYMKNQAQQQALSQSLQKSQADLNTQKLADMKGTNENEDAFDAALQGARPIVNSPTPMFPGSQTNINVPTYGRMTPQGLVESMAAHPGSEQTDVGRSVLSDWMKTQPKYEGRNGQALVPFSLGSGDNALTGGVETQTGKTVLDPNSVGRLAQARRAGMMPKVAAGELQDVPADAVFTPAANAPGYVKVTDSKGRFIKWVKTAASASGRTGSLFGPAADASATPSGGAPATPGPGSGISFDDFKNWGKAKLQDEEPAPFTDAHFQQWQDDQED